MPVVQAGGACPDSGSMFAGKADMLAIFGPEISNSPNRSQDACNDAQLVRIPAPIPMNRRSLLRKLAEGLTLAVGHQACRSMAIVHAEPAPKVSMSLPSPTTPPVLFSCDLSAPSQPLRHPWRHCVGSCHAPMALRADWQQQLARAHRELGFRHVRFHGLLSDDMGTLVNQDNQFLFSFFNIDRVFDFLLSIGMKPLVELSFMPATLSSDGNSVFRYRANITPPKRMEDWQLLMTTLVGHWVERYGLDEVAQWPLEVWNEPNLVAFWTGGQARYFDLFKATSSSTRSAPPTPARPISSARTTTPPTRSARWTPTPSRNSPTRP
jgi:hypothetical protein